MSLVEIALLAASGLAAGLVNALAGGGTFFTFTALVAVGQRAVAGETVFADFKSSEGERESRRG